MISSEVLNLQDLTQASKFSKYFEGDIELQFLKTK